MEELNQFVSANKVAPLNNNAVALDLVLQKIDVLVDGPFIESKKDLSLQ